MFSVVYVCRSVNVKLYHVTIKNNALDLTIWRLSPDLAINPLSGCGSLLKRDSITPLSHCADIWSHVQLASGKYASY